MNGTNVPELVDHLLTPNAKTYAYPEYDPRVESALSLIQAQLKAYPAEKRRWYAIKLFEQDEQVVEKVQLTDKQQDDIQQTIATAEKLFGDTSDAIMVNARYDFIARVIAMSVVDDNDFSESWSDKIDRVVTNRWLALPIFAW